MTDWVKCIGMNWWNWKVRNAGVGSWILKNKENDWRFGNYNGDYLKWMCLIKIEKIKYI